MSNHRSLRAALLTTLAGLPCGLIAQESNLSSREIPLLIEDYFPRPSLDEPCLSEGFDDAGCVMLPSALTAAPGRFQPMIQELETGLAPSAHFLEQTQALAVMNHLAYLRGKDFRFGRELTFSETLGAWRIRNFTATRGFMFKDPNAGFVAYHKASNTLAIVFHGSINDADWVTNLASVAVRFDAYQDAKGVPLPMVGRVHAGFLDKYLSCRSDERNEADRTSLLGLVDRMIAEEVPSGEVPNLKFYVTGHSQGAALAQIHVVHLCQHLRKHYGPEFSNAKDNRVHAWLLACPVGFDHTAAAFAESVVGKRNIFVQNTGLDIVPNLGFTPRGLEFRSIGSKSRQASLDSFARSFQAHCQAVLGHLRAGDLRPAFRGAMPASVARSLTSALHMASDNANYRDLGGKFAFDEKMVEQSREEITRGLQDAFNHKQERLQHKAIAAARWEAWTSCLGIPAPAEEPAEVAETPAPAAPAGDGWWDRLRGAFGR